MIRHVQKRPPGSNATPLFLFHDASGSVASYYELGSLGRDIYAIADVHTESDDGGASLYEMSRRYYAAIKCVISEGRALLGGWSLGGMIALQVAWIFAQDPKLEVIGIFMVESPYPEYKATHLGSEAAVSQGNPATVTSKMANALLQSVNKLKGWRVPVWRRQRHPHTVMLRAGERLNCVDQPALSLIDQFRDSPTLGWNERAAFAVVDRSYPIEGNHFTILEPGNANSVTEAIATVAVEMERLVSQEEDE